MRRTSGRGTRVRALAILSVIASMPLGACASGGLGNQRDEAALASAAARRGAPNAVMVNNNSWDRVTVFIGQGGMEWRIGDVEPMTQRILALGSMGHTILGRSAYFVGRRLAGGAFRSESFVLNPGAGVARWTIENQDAFSYVMIR